MEVSKFPAKGNIKRSAWGVREIAERETSIVFSLFLLLTVIA